jgi:hypothetical protein
MHLKSNSDGGADMKGLLLTAATIGGFLYVDQVDGPVLPDIWYCAFAA